MKYIDHADNITLVYHSVANVNLSCKVPPYQISV